VEGRKFLFNEVTLVDGGEGFPKPFKNRCLFVVRDMVLGTVCAKTGQD